MQPQHLVLDAAQALQGGCALMGRVQHSKVVLALWVRSFSLGCLPQYNLRTAQARPPFFTPVAAARTRSTSVARADRDGTGTIFRDQYLASYEAHHRQNY